MNKGPTTGCPADGVRYLWRVCRGGNPAGVDLGTYWRTGLPDTFHPGGVCKSPRSLRTSMISNEAVVSQQAGLSRPRARYQLITGNLSC